MPCCYILYSAALDRFYVGATHDNLDDRFEKHVLKLYGKSTYTAAASDWEIFLSIESTTFRTAVLIERHIKKMKSSVYIRNLKRYPEMIEHLREKFKLAEL